MLADRSLAAPIVRQAVLRSERLGRPVLASWSQRSTTNDAIDFFGQAPSGAERMLWLRPSTGEALVGVGAAHVLTARGLDRFKEISTLWRALAKEAVVEDLAESPNGGPLVFGGFSFDPLRAPTAAWKTLTDAADARFVLPRRMLAVHAGAAWLTTNVIAEPRTSIPHSAQVERPAADFGSAAEDAPLSSTAWKALVGSVARGIRHGQLGVEKVVVARAYHVQASDRIDPVAALRQLATSYPSCTVFAVAHGDACFLGATPERLIALHQGMASTMALAGSFPRGATPDEDQTLAEQLLRNPKERAEHAVVVGALRDGLGHVCTRIIADAQPHVQKLPNLQHLLTPIRGQVTLGVEVLELVERLHPTPAVGGFPRERALELIRATEGLDRGWYGGPIGWVNRAGEGEFVVGIRSALVRGASATLFAGCGIVAESDPAAEYAESEWKLRPMLAALGLCQR